MRQRTARFTLLLVLALSVVGGGYLAQPTPEPEVGPPGTTIVIEPTYNNPISWECGGSDCLKPATGMDGDLTGYVDVAGTRFRVAIKDETEYDGHRVSILLKDGTQIEAFRANQPGGRTQVIWLVRKPSALSWDLYDVHNPSGPGIGVRADLWGNLDSMEVTYKDGSTFKTRSTKNGTDDVRKVLIQSD